MGRTMIYSTKIYRNAIKGSVVYQDLTFPQSVSNNEKTIKFIQAQDNFTNSSGGHATLTAGGPTFKYVTVSFVSQAESGLDFSVYIFA